jgi:hypothetical protein
MWRNRINPSNKKAKGRNVSALLVRYDSNVEMEDRMTSDSPRIDGIEIEVEGRAGAGPQIHQEG